MAYDLSSFANLQKKTTKKETKSMYYSFFTATFVLTLLKKKYL
jgi:hypothetical protein